MALRAAIFGLLGAVTLASACQITPGEYRVYRIANEESERSAGCWPSPPGVDITGDSTTVRVGQTFAIFASDADNYFLDFEALSLAGTRDGPDYSFDGETVNVELSGAMGELTITDTDIFDIDISIQGKKVSGTSVLTEIDECTGGDGCPDNRNCTTTTNFVGSEIKDVELEHGV